MRLEAEQLEELAELVAERLAARLVGDSARPSAGGLVDAGTVAAALSVSRDFVYRNAERLGGRRFGDGPRPRLRFDLEEALERAASGSAGRGHGEGAVGAVERIPRRRRRSSGRSSAHLLPIRGGDGG